MYCAIEWWGRIRIDGEMQEIGLGDVAVIVPGQRHKVWQEGEEDLLPLVTCVPTCSTNKVVFVE